MSRVTRKTRILFISKNGTESGAGKALFRIHTALNQSNKFNSDFLVWEGVEDVGAHFHINKNYFVNKLYRRVVNIFNSIVRFLIGPKPGYIFSHNIFPNLSLRDRPLIDKADIIFLGWIGFGYVGVGQMDMFKNKRVYWRLSDVWAFTGGCHIPFGCEKFKEGCSQCPQLLNNKWIDWVSLLWKRKKRHYRKIDMSIIVPSRWMENAVRSSRLLGSKKIYRVPTGVDLKLFKPLDKMVCREQFGISRTSIVLLFGSVETGEKRKGMNYIIGALKNLKNLSSIELLVFGSSQSGLLSELDVKITFLGRIEGDENLANVYNAADIFLAPYIEDNLPNTVIEAIACGLPVVGFNSGGIPDLINHQYNGYLANVYDNDDFKLGIDWVVHNLKIIPFASNSRKISQQFSMDNQIALIEEILTTK